MIVNLLRGDLRHENAMADEAFALSPINARAALPTDTDYDAICDAFMETSRGRWFLREYAKRNRNADTQMVLEAVTRIEESIARQKLETAAEQTAAEPPVDIFPAVQAAILEARQQIAQGLVQDDSRPALDVIKSGMDTIRNVAWALRERGVDLQICGIFDHQVSLMMDGYLQLAAVQATNTTSDQVLAAFDGLLQRVSDIAAGDSISAVQPEPIQEPVREAPAADVHMPPRQQSDDAVAPTAYKATEAVSVNAAPSPDADTAFREIYGDEHDIEILESPVDDSSTSAAIDGSEDADFIQAITDTAQELARLETLDTVAAASQAAFTGASARIEAMIQPESEIEPEPMALPTASVQITAIPAAPAPMMAHAPLPQATPLPVMAPFAEPQTEPVATEATTTADKAAGTSLGHALLRSGLIRPNGTRTDPMAVFNRMSQAEKIAFMT